MGNQSWTWIGFIYGLDWIGLGQKFCPLHCFFRRRKRLRLQCESKKNLHCGFLTIFFKRFGIFNQCFTHLLYVPFYTRLQIYIQLFPTLTKLCHNKRDHPANNKAINDLRKRLNACVSADGEHFDHIT